MECQGEYRRRNPEASVLRRAVREGWPEVVETASARGGLPKRVHEEVQRFLSCGDLRRGFTAAQCQRCEETVLIAFSCKTRGLCPTCAAKRAHETSAHLTGVLPEVAWRQWTLTLPRQLRWPVVKDVKLLRAVERCLTRAVFRWQRRRAKELGVSGKVACGAVSQLQLFSSSLAFQPHWHLLVPEGAWEGEAFVALPPPSTEEVEAVLERAVTRLGRLFADRQPDFPEDGLDGLQAEGAQLALVLAGTAGGPKRRRRVAAAAGFSLHADTHVHQNDREGLARLLRYGARGPVAESRLSRRGDGTYVYETKKGVTLVLTAAQLVKRLLALVPPARLHLTSFHGALASHSKRRATVMQKAPSGGKEPSPEGSAPPQARRPRRPTLDFATLLKRTFGVDLWTCRCGGTRKVLAVVTSAREAERMLSELGLLPARPPPPAAQSPPQLGLAL